MSSSTRKPPLPSNPHRRSQPPSPAPSRASGRSPTPSSIPSATANGTSTPATIARRNTLSHRRESSASSPLSARSAVKTRPDSTDETELENAAILEDLRGRLAKSESAAEAAAENYEKQIKALQMRLEEALEEQSRQEEALHSKDNQIEALEIQVKELTRSKRDQENIYEAERIAAQQEKEELLDREAELSAIIQRLKDGKKSQRRTSYDSTEAESINPGFAPASHSPSPSPSNLVLQKDKIIEALRSELAEAQIRLNEAAHLDGTQLQQLEAQLLEARMTNARLMEDNEGYQLLLSSAALNGDFPRGDYITHAFNDHESDADSEPVKVPGSPSQATSLGGLNLADELEEADKEETDRVRKLEAELKQLKETNKAQSLYINSIIERILQHKDSEAILDKSAPIEKPTPVKPKEEAPTGFLQRTKSLVTGSTPRPVGPVQEHSSGTAANGNTFRPVTRSHTVHGPPGGARQHKRSQSDVSAVSYLGRRDGVITPRTDTFFGGHTGEHYTRSNRRARDSTISIDSGVSDTDSHMGSSIGSPITSSASSTYDRYSTETRRTFGTVAGGNKLRPLTLVQKTQGGGLTSPTGRKFSVDLGMSDNQKRTSWIGNWFSRGGPNGTAPASSGSDSRSLTSPIEKSTVVFEGKDVE